MPLHSHAKNAKDLSYRLDDPASRAQGSSDGDGTLGLRLEPKVLHLLSDDGLDSLRGRCAVDDATLAVEEALELLWQDVALEVERRFRGEGVGNGGVEFGGVSCREDDLDDVGSAAEGGESARVTEREGGEGAEDVLGLGDTVSDAETDGGMRVGDVRAVLVLLGEVLLDRLGRLREESGVSRGSKVASNPANKRKEGRSAEKMED